MSENEIEKKITDALASYIKNRSIKIEGSSQLREELGLDSMDTIELVFQLEEKFNIQISDDDLMGLKTVDNVVQYIEKRVSEKKESG
jgi:acyl carrier protein|tara:strand:- start:154 stop:414 length:261 start_codon:yes stop_codon:yes gene_type:complete